MIFRPELAALVLCGEKTFTRRLVSDNRRSPWWVFGCAVQPGGEYAVQPGRGKRSVGRVRAVAVRRVRLGYLTDAAARREGFDDRTAFERAWESINGAYDDFALVWRVQFEYVGPFYGTALARPLRSVAWDLRTAWAKGLRVSVRIAADVERVEGHVLRVSATDAGVEIGGWWIPLDRILSVHRPSRLGDSTFDDSGSERWRGQVPRALRVDPQQTSLEAG